MKGDMKMGLFKILGCMVVGVGAVAAAPFTGGGSLLGAATLAEALTVGTAVAGGAAGAVVGAAASDMDEDDRRNERQAAHENGFSEGIKKGNSETAKKFATILEKNDTIRIGAFALACYVANKDNDFSEEEKQAIERYFGRPDGITNRNVATELQDICRRTPSFDEIKSNYLDHFNLDDLVTMDEFINELVLIDQKISPEEKSFLEDEWEPYLKQRRQH